MLFEDVVKKYCSEESYEAKIAASRVALCKAEQHFPAGTKLNVLSTYSKHMMVMDDSGKVYRLEWSGDAIIKSELIETVKLADDFEEKKEKIIDGVLSIGEASIDKNRVFVDGVHALVSTASWNGKLVEMELSIKKVLGGKYKEISSYCPVSIDEGLEGLNSLYDGLNVEDSSVLSSMREQVRKCRDWVQMVDQATISVENMAKLLEDIVVLTKSVSMISAFISAGHKF